MMICILEMDGSEIAGWILAKDWRDAQEQVAMAGEPLLAVALTELGPPPPGKHVLPNGEIVLVSESNSNERL